MQDNEWQSGGLRRREVMLIAICVVLTLVSAALVLALTTRPKPTTNVTRTVPLPLGATTIEAGVPVGYSQNPPGAIDAATNYAVALNWPMLLHPDQIRLAVAAIAAADQKADLLVAADFSVRALNSSYGLSTNAAQGVAVVLRLVPIAWHLDSYDGQTAAVSIWAVWVFAEGGVLAPQQQWLTATFALQWAGGDWKVAGTSTRPGPVPAPPQQTLPNPSAPLPEALTNYEEYQHVSG
jgi:hypothetical protein